MVEALSSGRKKNERTDCQESGRLRGNCEQRREASGERGGETGKNTRERVQKREKKYMEKGKEGEKPEAEIEKMERGEGE